MHKGVKVYRVSTGTCEVLRGSLQDCSSPQHPAVPFFFFKKKISVITPGHGFNAVSCMLESLYSGCNIYCADVWRENLLLT